MYISCNTNFKLELNSLDLLTDLSREMSCEISLLCDLIIVRFVIIIQILIEVFFFRTGSLRSATYDTKQSGAVSVSSTAGSFEYYESCF